METLRTARVGRTRPRRTAGAQPARPRRFGADAENLARTQVSLRLRGPLLVVAAHARRRTTRRKPAESSLSERRCSSTRRRALTHLGTPPRDERRSSRFREFSNFYAFANLNFDALSRPFQRFHTLFLRLQITDVPRTSTLPLPSRHNISLITAYRFMSDSFPLPRHRSAIAPVPRSLVHITRLFTSSPSASLMPAWTHGFRLRS